MFIRKKIIKGHEYWYLVENTWENKTSKQKVIRYLGKRGSFDMAKVVQEIEKNKKSKVDTQ
ncbi:MAG: hypothetical protein K0B02_01000 [DPANN group archaeon]|nr:hypothetical protein [DPANN group archaeon]